MWNTNKVILILLMYFPLGGSVSTRHAWTFSGLYSSKLLSKWVRMYAEIVFLQNTIIKMQKCKAVEQSKILP